MGRINVMLVAKDTESCKETLLALVALANHPKNLIIHIAILGEKEESLVDAAAPAACKVEYLPGLSPGKALRKLYKATKKEKYALQVIGQAVFEPHWDSLLKEMVNEPKEKNAVFSYIPQEEECYALGLKAFGQEGEAFFQKGIRASSFFRPVEGLFALPNLLFGRGSWVQKALVDRWNMEDVFLLSLSIFASGYLMYTANHCICTPLVTDDDLKSENLAPDAGALKRIGEETWQAFMKKTELEKEAKTPSLKAFMGLGVSYRPYEVQVSLAEAINQYRGAKKQGESPIRPMFVTAWKEGKEPLQNQVQLEYFYCLSRLEYFPLTAYGPKRQLKTMQHILPNSFPMDESKLNYGQNPFLGKELNLFLLKAREQFPLYSHYGWVEMDYLQYSLYPKQAFTWQNLADDKIHIGVKNGQVDGQLFILPAQKVAWFVDRMEEGKLRGKKSTEEIFEYLIKAYKEEFTVYDYGENHQLLEIFLHE